MEKRLPWGRIVALARRPDTIGLGGEGGVRGIENGIAHPSNRGAAAESLRNDPAHTDRADRTADHARQICGGANASEAQVANVMLCLGKNALVPVREVAALVGASIDFDDPSAISVMLTKQDDGTVRVEIQSQEALREEKGHFRLVLDVKPDGEMTAREFEVSPNAATLRARESDRATAERVRRNEAIRATAAPILAMGDEPDGLGSAVRTRAESLSPDVKLDEGVLDRFKSRTLAAIDDLGKRMARNGGNLPTVDELRQVRDERVDAFFSRLQTAAAQVPEAQRAQFTRACLEHMEVPPPELCQATAQLAVNTTHALELLAAARDAGEARQTMEDLDTAMELVAAPALRAANDGRPAIAHLGSQETIEMKSIALRMALHTLAEQMGGEEIGMERLARALGREGGAFRDMLYDIAHAPGTDNQARGILQGELEHGAPAEAARFDPATVGERNLSLARQRQILGEGAFIARGAQVEQLNVNATLSRDMPAIREYVRTDAETTMRERLPADAPTSDPNDPKWVIHDECLADLPRTGISINDHFLQPTPGRTKAENEEAFVRQFPNRRTAAVLSTIANQTLPGFLCAAVINVTGQPHVVVPPRPGQRGNPTGEGMVMAQAMLGDPVLLGKAATDARIDSLGGDRYRVSYRNTNIASDNDYESMNGAERSMAEVSVEVDVSGNPPTVSNARVDLLLRGHEAVPGEELPPGAPPPAGRPGLRPPAPRI
jgi:hypothetical protein